MRGLTSGESTHSNAVCAHKQGLQSLKRTRAERRGDRSRTARRGAERRAGHPCRDVWTDRTLSRTSGQRAAGGPVSTDRSLVTGGRGSQSKFPETPETRPAAACSLAAWSWPREVREAGVGGIELRDGGAAPSEGGTVSSLEGEQSVASENSEERLAVPRSGRRAVGEAW